MTEDFSVPLGEGLRVELMAGELELGETDREEEGVCILEVSKGEMEAERMVVEREAAARA